LVFLDGVRLPDFRTLEQLSAATIESIEVLNGIDGTTYYGTNAVSGVIVIRTKRGSAETHPGRAAKHLPGAASRLERA